MLNRAYFSDDCHEKEVVTNLGELLNDGDLFVDLGASLGQFTYHANDAMQDGRIIAFEPDPIRFEELDRNCTNWQASKRNTIAALPYAVGDKTGPQSFFTTQSNVSGGMFARDVDPKYNFEEISVEGTTLDTLFVDDHPNLIKIDVEGAELRVLRGATKILSAGKSKLLLELHSFVDPNGQKSANEVKGYLQDFGYGRRNFHDRNLFVKT